MNVLKSCLMVVGLLAILLIGGCVMGAYSLGSAINSVINPKELTMKVDQDPDKVRTKLYRFLKSASDESTAKPVTVAPYSDGSVHMTYGNSEPYDMNLTIMVTPEADGKASTAKATWSAASFASHATGTVTEDAVNRAINKRLRAALVDIDQSREVSTSMRLSAVLEDARNDKISKSEN